MSATFSEPRTFSSLKSLDLTLSCTHKSAVAKCRILPKPRRRVIPIAAVESVLMVRDQEIPKSLAIEMSPRLLDAPLHIP